MRKKLIFSLIALIYISVFKITDFETGDVGLATILIYIGVPLFVLVSLSLFVVSFYNFYKEKFNIKSICFVSLILNLISLTLTFDAFSFFLNPINR